MKSIQILDCTLRDGGFVNDWNFGLGSMKSIISRLDKAAIDMIEIGFIDERRGYDPDRAILPDVTSFQPMLEGLDIDNAMILAMIDYGTCDISKICEKKETLIDGIRVIFKKKDQDDALVYLSMIKEKGYKIYVNPVSITGYSDDELIALLHKINLIEPDGVSIVDTYGLMHRKELLNYFRLFDSHLNKSILIGYHAHNNFQMVYANSIELCELESDRRLVIDSSLYGMGKGAGNANTELVTMYCNENFSKNYSTEHLLEAIDVDILKEYSRQPWGYSLLYYLAASNDCHPEYVKYLLDKKTLSVNSINILLSELQRESKLTFDKNLIENMYKEYQNISCNDNESYTRLSKELEEKCVLLLGPGTSIIDDYELIHGYIKSNLPIVLSINFISDSYPIDYVFMGNSKRYNQFLHKIYGNNKIKVITTSNVTDLGKPIDFVFNYETLIVDNIAVRDNPLLMIVKILKKCGVREIKLAGFDGYTENNETNYYREYIPLLYCQEDVLQRNSGIAATIKDISMELSIESLTRTLYL